MHVIYMSANVGIQPLRCTDSHGHLYGNALTCRNCTHALPSGRAREETRAWAGEDHDPERFDLDAANAAVAAV